MRSFRNDDCRKINIHLFGSNILLSAPLIGFVVCENVFNRANLGRLTPIRAKTIPLETTSFAANLSNITPRLEASGNKKLRRIQKLRSVGYRALRTAIERGEKQIFGDSESLRFTRSTDGIPIRTSSLRIRRFGIGGTSDSISLECSTFASTARSRFLDHRGHSILPIPAPFFLDDCATERPHTRRTSIISLLSFMGRFGWLYGFLGRCRPKGAPLLLRDALIFAAWAILSPPFHRIGIGAFTHG